ncbi:MAG: TonB-dependent receptor [Kangiellaceae bacterium]|nr:TonB-dependent receptor [Kangiellaceae bacterium]
MGIFKPSKLSIALLSTGMITFGMPSFAEEVEKVKTANTDVAETESADEEENRVIITGIRGSLARSQALKMSSTSIIEAISAEDIGKLPDTSIAESLARLPGVTGERRNGRTSGLSIRGLNENYIATSLNGRELLGMGDNRGVEYDLYPTEFVKELIVYKTPQADLLAQGIGGTVDLRTVSPLSSEATMTANMTYEKNAEDSANPDYDNDGNRFSFNYVNQFADDTIGIALVIAEQKSVRQENNQRVWGYPTSGVSAGDVVFGGHDTFIRSAQMDRTSVAAVLEYAPSDKLTIQLDALYIDFDEKDVRRGIEEAGPEWGGGNYTASTTDSGLVTSGYFDGFHSVIRNDARSQQSELTTVAINVEYQLNNSTSLEFDYSTGSVDKTMTDIESYSGVGRPGFADRPLSARSFEMTGNGVFFGAHPTVSPVDLSDPNVIRLAGPQAWGGSLAPVPAFNGVPGFAPNTAQDGFVNQPEFEEDLDNLRFEINGDLELSILSGYSVGIAYSDRSKSKVNEGAYLTAPTWPGHGPVPSEYVFGATDLSFFGLGNIIAYDSLGLYNSGYYISTAASGLETGRFGDTYTIDEQILTIFAKADIDADIGSVAVTGNFGLQYIDSEQKATGFSSVTGSDLYVNAVPVNGGADYTDVLPTLNLSFEVADSQFIRTAFSKVMSRPRMDDMRPNTAVSFSFNDSSILDANVGPWSGSTGNAALKPLEANQYDFAYENYYAEDGFFAASFFYKDLTNWHRQGFAVEDFSSFFIPGYHVASTGEGPATFLGVVTSREDGLEGFIRGREFQASVPLSIASDALDGFGVVMSATFLDGSFDDGSPIPGLSQESYALTAYYEKNGFEVRVSGTKRNGFDTETRGISLSLVQAGDLGAELWDAQIGYNFEESGIEWLKGLRVTLQGQNLTDEKTIQANDDARQVTSYQSFGANYLLALNYEF